jgi:cation:H+ antiporter
MDAIIINSLGFIISSAIIIYSGTNLAKHGNRIAEITGWGKAWIGLILMAAVTSLPELMTGISSVAIIDTPNLAAGDVFGSCVFNLLILSIIDVKIKQPLTSLVKRSHLVAGLFGIILLAISGMALLMTDIPVILNWISPFSVLLIIVYLIAVYSIYQYDSTSQITHDVPAEKNESTKNELKNVFVAYFGNALLVIIAAIFLPYFGEHIANLTGVGNTFFGTLFLAASTSLPELVVSFATIKLGAFDLAMGNLLGSNIFNMFILALDDVFYTKGSLFAHIKPEHLESVIIVIVMTTVVGLGLMVKPTKKYWRLSYDTMIILILYICLMTILFFKN